MSYELVCGCESVGVEFHPRELGAMDAGFSQSISFDIGHALLHSHPELR
jgi:hypothetical protein